MKKLIVVIAAITMVFALTPMLWAQNTASGPTVYGDGGLGSFFVPDFTAVGEAFVAKKTDVKATTAVAADCCIAGDTYKFVVKSRTSKDKVTWTSAGSLKADCSAVSTFPDQRVLSLAKIKKVKLKALDLPGGVPADAYLTIDAVGFIIKKGQSSCGF
jgi:hypothetical protein